MKIADKNISNKEVMQKWHDGEIVWSAELGGLGPGYEQAIQDSLFDLFSYLIRKKIEPKDLTNEKETEYNKKYDKITMKILKGRGLSGAQAGAAKCTAYQFLRYGYKEMMAKLEADRSIQVQKTK